MSDFMKATKLKLRFPGFLGNLSTEDLWDLTLQELNSMAISLRKKIKESEEGSFLDEISNEDSVFKLRFDIVVYIIEAKKEERKEAKEYVKKKFEREQLLSILAEKQNESLKSLTEEELKERLEEL